MKLKNEATKEKLRGAYYTPKQLADSIINKLVESTEKINILEPSCGDGVFIESIFENNKFDEYNISAIEIEKKETIKLVKKYKDNKKVKIINNDFFKFYLQNKKNEYDLIIGNPPYVRYQYLDLLQRIEMSEILVEQGLKSNKLINAWVGFVVACSTLLSENGQLIFVLPAEILQVVYAQDLRKFLINTFNEITVITFEKMIFENIEQEILILSVKKSKVKKGIRIVQVKDINGLNNKDFTSIEFQNVIDSKDKWTKYFNVQEDIDLLSKIKLDERFQKFSDVATINVGITTGNNSYFSLDKKTIEQYNLEEYTMPLIGKSAHVHGIYFTKKDLDRNFDNNKKCRLLNINNIEKKKFSESLNDYIKYGETNELNNGYKCLIRDDWYVVPSIWIPDAFFLRRNNLYPKFVINKCSAVSTDTMHRIKFFDNIDKENILLSYYNSISLAFTEICGRSYGGGVLEILPSEVGEIMLPKINNIDKELQKKLLSKIDSFIRKNNSIEEILDIIDKSILIDYLDIEESLCIQFRGIWKKMQNRRLSRGKIQKG